MDSGGPWYSDERRRWLLPALIGGGVLLLILLIAGALALRGRGNNSPTATRIGSPTQRVIIGTGTAGTPAALGTGTARPTTIAPTTGIGAAPTATQPPAAATKTFVVSGTGGDGLILRRTPGGDQLAVLPDGAKLTQAGADRDVNGVTWRNVRAEDGQEGWVAAQFTTESR